jgi:hypothetical protein
MHHLELVGEAPLRRNFSLYFPLERERERERKERERKIDFCAIDI